MKKGIKFVKEKNLLRAISYGAFEYDWIDNILDHLCQDFWSVGEQGEVVNSELNINNMIATHLI